MASAIFPSARNTSSLRTTNTKPWSRSASTWMSAAREANKWEHTFSTWIPGLFFGKGLGDLPQGLPWLRPLAITGLVGVALPSSARTDGSRNPAVLQSGFAVEYSIIYLQEHVRNIGLRAPFDRLIPLVEV